MIKYAKWWFIIYAHLLTIARDLSNVSALNFEDKISKIPIYKCSCGPNQALRNGDCVPALNIVPLWHAPEGIDYYVNITQFKNVIQKTIICQEGFSKVEVGEEFLIYSSGLFDNLRIEGEPPQEEYCIEYIYIGDNLHTNGHVCVQNPSISVCCPPGHLSTAEGKCYPDQFEFQPPLLGSIKWDNYNLKHNDLECGEGKIMKKAPLSIPYDHDGASLLGYPLGSVLLWLSEHSFNQILLTPDEYCVSIQNYRNGNYSYHAQFCIPDPQLEHEKLCNNTSCVRKCCSNGYIYHEMYRHCVPSDSPLSYTLYDLMTVQEMKIIVGFPLCKDFYLIEVNNENNSMILEDGSLTTKDGLKRTATQFCLDEVIGGNTTKGTGGLVCFKNEDKCGWRWTAGSLLLGFSCLFYFATLVVYISINELRTKMVGKCLISEVSSLLIAYLTLIFLQNARSYKGVYCNFPGTVEHIAILSSFFWLNVMCYDMWRTISSVRPAGVTRNTTKSFIFYCFYAWGFPIVIGTIRLIIDHVPYEQEDYPWLIKAHIGLTHCFFSSNYSGAKWAYLYGPILILLLTNLCFFIHVAIILFKMHKERKKLISEDSSKTGKNLNATRQRVLLYLKLFIVMGLSWLLEIIMWVAVPESDCYFWGLDIVNMFQGVFIFIIFVCKKSTLKKIKSSFEEFSTPSTQRYELARQS